MSASEIVNTLMHREFSSGYQAKFIIEKDRMYVENANRARKDGIITPENLEPYAKNPLIASFFRITVPLNDEFSWDAQKTLTLQTEQVTEQVKRLVECLKPCPLSTKEILQELGLKHRPTLMSDYIKPALALGLIEMTQPDSPKSPTQKYKVKLQEEVYGKN